MQFTIRTSAERETSGICPDCKEWTDAGDSCCGAGAYVEGGVVSDESVIEARENPTVAVYLKRDKPYDECKALHAKLWEAGLYPSLFGIGEGWNVVIRVPVSALPVEE